MGLIDKPAPAQGVPVNQPYPAGLQYIPSVNQPHPVGPQYTPPVAPGQGVWSSSLCACFDDLPSCCLTWCCPCITFGRVAEIVDKGTSSCGMAGGLYALIMALTACQCIYSCTYRTKMRNQYGIPGSECGDCCTHFCCECCALAQMSRELTARGYDVSLGWDGNLQKQNQGVNMAPVAPGGMYR